MAGTIAPGQLTVARNAMASDGVTFAFATPADDPALRALLRDAPMHGDIALSLEREPDYFASLAVAADAHHTIVARETTSGELLAAGSVAESLRHINGQPTRVGYLTALRLAPAARGRTSVLRRGYHYFHDLHTARAGPTVYLTSIAADNAPARRFLEAGLTGMPAYTLIDPFATLVLRVRRRGEFYHPGPRARDRLRRFGLTLRRARPADAEPLADFINAHARRHQFSPVVTPERLFTHPGLTAADFRLALDAQKRIVACAALWDQSAFKQVVIRGYSPRLARLRPAYNLLAAFTARPRLPAPGQPLRQAHVAHLAADDDRLVAPLIESLHGPAYQRRIDHLITGFSTHDPRLPVVRRAFRARTYMSQLYTVHWPDDDDDDAPVPGLDPRPAAPEVALL